jgi:hypothetical protein
MERAEHGESRAWREQSMERAEHGESRAWREQSTRRIGQPSIFI